MPDTPAAATASQDWSPSLRAAAIEQQMTDEERLLLVSVRAPDGRGVPRLGVPGLRMGGTPWGGAPAPLAKPAPAALPTALALAASFHPALAREAGAVLGGEARARGVNVLVGGGVDLVRDPAHAGGGAWLSEDPLLAALIGAGAINGIQDQGVVAAIRHRWPGTAAAQRETDLLALQMVVEWSQPGCIVVAGASRPPADLLRRWAFRGWTWPEVRPTAAAAPPQHLAEEVRHILAALYAVGADRDGPVPAIDGARRAALALEVARQGIVLLKNEGVLPLSAARPLRIALVGGALPELRHLLPDAQIEVDGGLDLRAAARLARACDVALVFCGGGPAHAQVAAVAEANPNTVVVLEHGGPTAMPWLPQVRAVVQAWYPAQARGQAMAELLAGVVPPCGRLPLTFPPGGVCGRDEGTEVGYRGWAARGVPPLFPFGHGLAYARFAYGELQLADEDTVTASFTVTNTGDTEAVDVPQLYLTAGPGGPRLRLLDFERLVLPPHGSRRVRLTADPRLLARFDAAAGTWKRAGGRYTVALARSANAPVCSAGLDLPERSFGS